MKVGGTRTLVIPAGARLWRARRRRRHPAQRDAGLRRRAAQREVTRSVAIFPRFVRRPAPSQLSVDLDRAARVDDRIDDAERGAALARVAAGAARAQGPRARPGRPGQSRADHLLLDRQRRRGRRVEPAPPDAVHPDRLGAGRRWRWRVLAFRGSTASWPLYALAALGAAVSTFDLPARQALVPMLVPREHLPNAISLNTIMFQTASVAGPALFASSPAPL